jgi:hypothetical protein
MIAWFLFVGGGGLCLLNFYLSFLRYPVHRALGRSRDSYRRISGFPLVGSLTVAVAWIASIRHMDSKVLDVLTGLLAVLDTGGIHWFAFSMLLHRLGGVGKTKA